MTLTEWGIREHQIHQCYLNLKKKMTKKSSVLRQENANVNTRKIAYCACVVKTIPAVTLGQDVAAVAEWYRYRTVACFVTGSSPVPLKTRRVGQRCTLNVSRAETSSRWCGVVVRRGGASSGVVHVT
ncbi:uncharacterized protein TNCV_5025111 [Trichonephila clavipes]|nr:uncharacterized protein TNCV_5025111 [Trichonephila clavipes]